MSSCENEMTRWNLRHIRRITEFLEPATSSSYATKLSSEAPISSIDQCLHIPGKADSAYSSFSGGSNIPECHIPLCYSDHDNLQLEQLAYMDSEYVRGVFNPCAAYSNLKQIYQDKPVAMNMYNNMDNSSPCESTVVPGTLYKPPSPVATLPFCLPHPSFQPAQADSCKTNRNTDQSNSGICLDSTIQAEESSDDSSKTLPFDSSTKCKDDCWLSRCKNQSPGLELENSDIWYLTNQRTTRKNETSIPTKHYLNFQDYMESGSLVHTQKVHNSVYNYKIPEALNSKFSPLPHTICSAVNDTQENKQSLYACSVHKPTFTEADQPCTMSVSSEPEGQFCGDEHSGLDQEICENYPSLKVTDRILPSATAWGIINTYEDKSHCFSSREENSRSAGQPLLKQQDRRQKSPSQGVDIAEIHHSEVYGTTKTISYCKHYEESASQMLNGVKKAKQNENDSPDSLTKPTQEEMLASVHLPQQFSKVESQCQDDSANRKINRKTTPLLYYLSGGKNTNILSNPNQLQEDSAMKSPRSDHSVSAEPTEIPRDCNNCVNDIVASQKTELILGSPASSVDEKFQNDYREKLKIAQRKVLRETSFKRKDLQMSLPIRLKQKPSSRPSIHHLRSLSLSSTNENCKLIPPHKPLENISKEEDLPKPQASRIGGRKRITREQKKISYSEPEKLNQLDDQRDHSTLWRKKNARSRSDEINDQDNVIVNNKAFENQSRGLSKAELKQIQHNALLQYMERKIGQWPAAAHSSALQKPPLQMRPSNSKKFSEDSISNLSSSKKSQNVDHSCQFPDLGRNPETPPLIFSTTSITPASDSAIASSSVPKKSHWKMQSIASEGSCVNRCASTKSLFHSGASASGKGHGRSKSTPSPMQDIYKSAACPSLSSQAHKYPSQPMITKQNTDTSGRRGRSMEETGSSEMVRLSPLSQSTDHLHHLKNLQPSSGQMPDKNFQRPNHQSSALQNCDPTSGPLFRPSYPDAGLRVSDSMVQALEQPSSTNKQSNTFISLGSPSFCHVPPLSVGRSQTQSVPLEFLDSSPAPLAEMDNCVFNDSLVSGSEKASTLSFPYRQSKNSIPDRIQPDPVLTVSASQVYLEGRQIKECNASFYVAKKEKSGLGSRNGNSEGNISGENSHCTEMAPEFSAFILKERINKESQLKKERSNQPQMSNASERIQWQQLQVTDRRTGYCSENTTYCTTILDSQGDKSTEHPSANVNQSEHDHAFQEHDTELSTEQLTSQEGLKCENLTVEIITKNKPLVDILRPHPIKKTALDLMEGLFPGNILVSDGSFRIKRRNQSVQENDQRTSDRSSDLSHETGYFLVQRVDDPTSHINQILSSSRECLDDPENVISKKKELISNIQLKLQTLWDEKELIQCEAKEYSAQGKELESLVQDLCKPNEYERYMMFIGDLEKVVSLLLCLSSRLARVQNAMENIDENTDAEEKQSLNERHSLLSRQREDAKDLKDNLDRRERVVSGILSKYLTESQLQDYRHFVQAKTSLLIEQKILEEQIKFLEEQLERLEESIPPYSTSVNHLLS